MPHFLFFGSDGPDGPQIRARVREDHRAYIKVAQPGCRLISAGPLLSDDGEKMNGTFLAFEADDRAAVERFVASDPYNLAKLFERQEIRRINWTVGLPGA